MKYLITIMTEGGAVALMPTGPDTFDLRGSHEAVESLQEAVGAFEQKGNQSAMLGDQLARLLYLDHEASKADGPGF